MAAEIIIIATGIIDRMFIVLPVPDILSVCKAEEGDDAVASLTNDNAADGKIGGTESTVTRACLKIAFRQMCVTICGRFDPNEGGVVGYVDRMRDKYTAKWGVQMAGMNFQTRSRACRAIYHFPTAPYAVMFIKPYFFL